jgi:hypothetical protein
MYLLGHLGFTSLIGYLLDKYKFIDPHLEEKAYNRNAYWIFLLSGSMFPDIIDKSVGSLIFSTGRWLGHTLLFILVASIIIGLFFRDNGRGKVFGLYFFIGNVMHLVLDQPSLGIGIPLFPLFPDPFLSSEWNSFLFGFTDPFVWLTEAIGLLILVLLSYLYNLEKKKKIGLFLFVLSYLIVTTILYYFWVMNI